MKAMGKIVEESLFEFNKVFHAVDDGWGGVKSMSPTSVLRLKDKVLSLFDKGKGFNVGQTELPQRFTVGGANNDATPDNYTNFHDREDYSLHKEINGIEQKMIAHNNKGGNYRVFKNQASKPELKPEKK